MSELQDYNSRLSDPNSRKFETLSYLPPLTVYLAAGISGLTGIAGTFFVKDYLDLPAEFLAMLGFGVGLFNKMATPNHLTSLDFMHSDISSFQARRRRRL